MYTLEKTIAAIGIISFILWVGYLLYKSQKRTYKFRAECFNDVKRFLDGIYFDVSALHLRDLGAREFPDVEVTFKSSCDLSTMRKQIDKISDLHVISETLKPYKKYTGFRE